MIRRSARAVVALAAAGVLSGGAGCGDVTSDLITHPAAGSSGASPGGSGAGGSSSSGSAGGGSPSGGASAGTSAGTGGTPECTVHDDCTDSERIYCHPMRRTCVECTEEAHCDDDENCSSELGECATSCSDSAGCAGEDEDLFCDPLILVCVECLDDADCPSNQCSNWQCGS